MKIKFISNENIRKLCFVYGLEPLKGSFLQMPQIFIYKDRLANGSNLYYYIRKHNKIWSKLFSALLNKNNIKKKLKTINIDYKILSDMLEKFKIPQLAFNNKSLIEFQNNLKKDFYQHEKLIDEIMKKRLGFNLPEEIFIIITEKMGGSLLCNEPVIIEIGKRNNATSVLIHEILHANILNSKIIKDDYKNEYTSLFIEALIQYFAPFGILTGDSNVIKKEDIIEYYNKNAYIYRGEIYSKFLRKLLPIMKKYYKNNSKLNIFEYLKNTSFKKYIN